MTEERPDPGSAPEPDDDQSEEGRWKRYESTIRARLAATTDTAESRRGSSLLIDSAFLVWERNRILPASLLVGALASRIVIFIVPLFALLVFSFGLYGDLAHESGADAVRQAGMAVLLADAVDDTTGMSDGFRFFAFFATVFAALYAANTLGRLLRRAAALVWGVPYEKVATPWVLPFVVILLTIVGWALSNVTALSANSTFEVVLGAVAAEVILLAFFWTLVSRFLPRDPEATRWADLIPGSLFVALGIVALRVAMVVYFAPEVASLSERYGSIALALVMLTWAYWLGMIVVGSAEINAAMFRSRRERQKAKRA